MAPRANWKGFLRLSLVTCPVALYPATSETEKVSFNQINRKTGHRIKYAKVDADTGEEVATEDIVKGYKVDTDTYHRGDRRTSSTTSRWNRPAPSRSTSSSTAAEIDPLSDPSLLPRARRQGRPRRLRGDPRNHPRA